MTEQLAKFRCQAASGPATVALVALLAVVLTLDAAGDYPKLLQGPGLTLDESFNVQMGVYQWRVLRNVPDFVLLLPESVTEAFGPKSNYNPDHPPLGRIWLGLWHDLVEWLFPPADHPPDQHGIRFVTDCARVGSAMAFALTVFVVGAFTTKWYGRTAGLIASISLVLMPRLFAHAHIASLETFLNLTYSATILAVAHWWPVRNSGQSRTETQPSPGGPADVSLLVAVLTGILFGLALLSKMQAILIPPTVGLWTLWHWRVRAIKPLALFGLVGLIVFFIGWPWLWLDPAKHFHEYFARTTNRAVLNCYYLGKVWADKDVPWHYPFVMFAVTVPVGLHVLGLVGCVTHLPQSCSEVSATSIRRSRFGVLCQPREQLLLMATLFPLLLFALPGVAVYDGERLFLVSFPIWAVLIGRGAEVAMSQLRLKAEYFRWPLVAHRRTRGTSMALFLLGQSVGVIVMHPCQLSYYNLLVGGLSGADRLGFERTYWGDSVTRSLLASLPESPESEIVYVRPVLHQFQLDELLRQSPLLRKKKLSLRADQVEHTDQLTDAWLLYSRKADVPAEMWGGLNGIGERRHGVVLAVWRNLALR